MFTKVESHPVGWAIRDPIVRLRRTDADQVFALEAKRYLIGSAALCSIRLDDDTQTLSREHAELVLDHDVWWVRDRTSTNGTRQDGERRDAFPLAPGVEIGLGALTLVAESERSIALLELLRAAMGWATIFHEATDRALQAIRQAAARRTTLALVGPGDLSSLSARIDRLALGGLASPIVHARSVDEAVRRTRQVQSFALIEVPPPSGRADELERLFAYLTRAAAKDLGATYATPRARDADWMRTLELPTLGEADECARRLVAIRTWGITQGAGRLGITHGALSRWARRHHLET